MSGGAGLVLVVEAERSVSAPLEHLLRLRNFETVMAETPERALEVLRTHKPAAAIIDLDIQHGVGRDVIVRMPPRAPVIMVAASRAAGGELERLRPRTRLVEKPCSLTWLLDSLEAMLNANP